MYRPFVFLYILHFLKRFFFHSDSRWRMKAMLYSNTHGTSNLVSIAHHQSRTNHKQPPPPQRAPAIAELQKARRRKTRVRRDKHPENRTNSRNRKNDHRVWWMRSWRARVARVLGDRRRLMRLRSSLGAAMSPRTVRWSSRWDSRRSQLSISMLSSLQGKFNFIFFVHCVKL